MDRCPKSLAATKWGGRDVLPLSDRGREGVLLPSGDAGELLEAPVPHPHSRPGPIIYIYIYIYIRERVAGSARPPPAFSPRSGRSMSLKHEVRFGGGCKPGGGWYCSIQQIARYLGGLAQVRPTRAFFIAVIIIIIIIISI